MPYSRNKKKLTVTIDNGVIDAIEKIKATMKYPNRSAATNKLLLKGLEAQGIQLAA